MHGGMARVAPVVAPRAFVLSFILVVHLVVRSWWRRQGFVVAPASTVSVLGFHIVLSFAVTLPVALVCVVIICRWKRRWVWLVCGRRYHGVCVRERRRCSGWAVVLLQGHCRDDSRVSSAERSSH